MFCFGFETKKSRREVEQEYWDRVLRRLSKKSYLKPDGFFGSMIKKSDSKQLLFKPEDLRKEEVGFLSFIGIACLELNFHEFINRNEKKYDKREIVCVGIPRVPLMPVKLWDEQY